MAYGTNGQSVRGCICECRADDLTTLWTTSTKSVQVANDADPIGYVADTRSGVGFDWQQATAGNRPTYKASIGGFKAIFFPGTGNVNLDGGQPAIGESIQYGGYTFYVVGQFVNFTSSFGPLIAKWDGNTSDAAVFFTLMANAGTASLANWNNASTIVSCPNYRIAANTRFLAVYQWNPVMYDAQLYPFGQHSLWVNGRKLFGGIPRFRCPSNGAAGWLTANWKLGNTGPSNAFPLNGYIHHWAMYNCAHTPTEIETVGQYMATLWNVPYGRNDAQFPDQ